MKKPALVIMAAGMGSRYGGLKQIDPIGPNGEIIMDYSVYDALKLGFGKVVFIIKEENHGIFRETIGKKIEEKVETLYVFQSLDDLPKGFTRPEGREKPWGTGHAVLSCRDHIDEPFVVINADDFYGRASFGAIYDYFMELGRLRDRDVTDEDNAHKSNIDEDNTSRDITKGNEAGEDSSGRGIIQNVKAGQDNENKDPLVRDYAMVGFTLKNTLTESGHVARGICRVNSKGYLEGIEERTKIKRFSDSVRYEDESGDWIKVGEDSIVSMNMWGFTPDIFKGLEKGFSDFLKKAQGDILTKEFFLPNLVGDLLKAGKARVKVLPTDEHWYGVTYKEDRPMVEKALRRMISNGIYPEKL